MAKFTLNTEYNILVGRTRIARKVGLHMKRIVLKNVIYL